MYSPQDPYSQQQAAYPPQNPYQPQDPYSQQQAAYPPQNPYQPQDPYSQQQAAYPPQNSYASQTPGAMFYSPQANMAPRNLRARRAMTNGIAALIFSLFTITMLAGYAGLITGTFAIVYGFMGLGVAKQLPNNAGRGQAITGIVLGFIAWFLVIVSFIARA